MWSKVVESYGIMVTHGRLKAFVSIVNHYAQEPEGE